MSTDEPVLPTIDILNVDPKLLQSISPASVTEIASNWLLAFTKALSSTHPDPVLALLQPDAFWRDILALTWNFRTFHGHEKIKEFLNDRLLSDVAGVGWSDLAIRTGEGMVPSLQTPFPDIAWIQFFISFNTKSGSGTGIVRLVPIPISSDASDGLTWKAHTIFTSLAGLHNHPELLGPLRDPNPNHGHWPEERERQTDFLDRDPAVVIIGGGQSGLDVAARLKCLGVDCLIIEKNKTVGQQWKDRYEALCLHDPVWYDHMPYLPFPLNWPVYTPAPKLSQWLHSYAESMELNVWTSSIVHSVHQSGDGSWKISVTRTTEDDLEANGEEGELDPRVERHKKSFGTRSLHAQHVVFAIGLASGVPNVPSVRGMSKFQGSLVHSIGYETARDYVGQKVLVVGACTSAHDIAHDLYSNGVAVTMLQRSSTYIMSTKNGWKVNFAGLYEENGPPTEVADLLNASYPNKLLKLVHQRTTAIIKELDHEILTDLEKVGFKLNYGIDGSGFALLAWSRAGGYYLGTYVGASRLIADGKIKLISGTDIDHLSGQSVVFSDGRKIECDVVIFATGFGDGRAPIASIINPSLGQSLQPLWGLDSEGEIQSVWRGTGVDNLWVMTGNLALCRFHSLHVALQIKAQQEGIWDGKRY